LGREPKTVNISLIDSKGEDSPFLEKALYLKNKQGEGAKMVVFRKPRVAEVLQNCKLYSFEL